MLNTNLSVFRVESENRHTLDVSSYRCVCSKSCNVFVSDAAVSPNFCLKLSVVRGFMQHKATDWLIVALTDKDYT